MSTLLEQCLSRIAFYQNVPRVRQDMQTLLYNCSTLKPSVGIFQASTGNITLFYLSGVVPISYKGANYNIPVTIYIDPPYPQRPPRVFVTPTSEMAIKQPHGAVDMNGRVSIAQLVQWNMRSSSLVEIIGILSSIFSSDPPVVSTKQVTPPVSSRVTPVVASVVTRSGIPINKREMLLKSLMVKIRARLPVVLKAQIDALNEAKKVEYRINQKKVAFKQLLAEIAAAESRLEQCRFDLVQVETQAQEIIRRNSTAAPLANSSISNLDASTVVGQQVIDLLAEDFALEDVIDSFATLSRDQQTNFSASDLVRETRVLTRKVFETKYLGRKALVVLQTAQ